VLSPGDDLLYEVVDNQVVALAPMGAYEVWLATVLVARLATFAAQHQLGRAVQEMLFDLTVATGRKRRPSADLAALSSVSTDVPEAPLGNLRSIQMF
jgi:hypothetical protein